MDPGRRGATSSAPSTLLLDATRSAAIATGILNIWMQDPEEVARESQRALGDHPERFVLGLGASHAALVEQFTPKPLPPACRPCRRTSASSTRRTPPVPAAPGLLAALGPQHARPLRRPRRRRAPVPRDRRAHAQRARDPRPDAVLAPELPVVLDRDSRAGAGARPRARRRVPGRCRTTRATCAAGVRRRRPARAAGSDRLVDAIVAVRRRGRDRRARRPSTSPPAPTTSASRSSGRWTSPCSARRGGAWRRPSSRSSLAVATPRSVLRGARRAGSGRRPPPRARRARPGAPRTPA